MVYFYIKFLKVLIVIYCIRAQAAKSIKGNSFVSSLALVVVKGNHWIGAVLNVLAISDIARYFPSFAGYIIIIGH